MLKVVVFALSEDNARGAILRLQNEKIIAIVEWLGSDKGHGVITHDYATLHDKNILKEYYRICPKEIYDKVYKNLYVFLDMVFRNSERPLYEYVNLFNLWVNYYYGLFSTEKIDALIFGDNPHFGVDSIAKDVAKAMGIKTILFKQAPLKNHFFAFQAVDDIGVFDSLPNCGIVNIKIEKKYEKDLYYMKNIKVTNVTSIVSVKNLTMRKLFLKIKRNRKVFGYKITRASYDILAKKFRRDYAKRVYHEETTNALKCAQIDLKKEYVYFPLHLQPEMTTSVLGKEYCDQMLAIERLAEFIPDNWLIYVKENPKQSYYMREQFFFDRMALLRKVQLVGREYNTYDLIRNSQFVATIAGTAGWEAVSGGKPVVVFGLAWYRKFPGVFEFKDTPLLEDILNCEINHEELENAYNTLMSKAYVGVLECGSEKTIAEYTNEKNNEYLFEALKRILSLIDQA